MTPRGDRACPGLAAVDTGQAGGPCRHLAAFNLRGLWGYPTAVSFDSIPAMVRGILLGVALGVLVAVPAADAVAQEQSTENDAEARNLFEAGRSAFASGRYEEALGHFKRAYELSGRTLLLYNMGVAAERLRRDQEALEAFEGFLAGAPPDGPEVVDARSWVAVLRERVARQQAQSPPDAAATAPPTDDAGSNGPGIAPWLLVGAGAAVLAVPIIGIATAGGCTEEVGGTCVRENEVNPAPTGLLIALGVAAIVGGIVWYLVGGDDDTPGDERAERAERRMAW